MSRFPGKSLEGVWDSCAVFLAESLGLDHRVPKNGEAKVIQPRLDEAHHFRVG
jgi:hypothetical protein